MAHEKILVVEDEKRIADIVKAYLEREGYQITVASTGESAVSLLNEGFDLVILDLMLPDIDGETICASLREFSDVPVIMLTAKSSEDDKVKGLGIGADDYVVKPFSAKELVARVKAHLRRTTGAKKGALSFNNGTLTINPDMQEVKKQNKPVELTTTEFKILLIIAENPQVVFSRLQIINIVQGFDFEGFDRVVDAHVKNLRQKIEDDPRTPLFIKTVYGKGYKFIGIPDA
ncbi:MAG: response regulator transcription factor [Nitrospirota bacterium]